MDDRALDFYDIPSAVLEYQYRFFALAQSANIFLFTDAIAVTWSFSSFIEHATHNDLSQIIHLPGIEEALLQRLRLCDF